MALRFRIGSIPVEVHFFFFLTALLLGVGGERDAAATAGWVGIVFASVLLHELGHALAGKAYGLAPVITLHGMGGTTSWTEASRRKRLGHGAQMLISFAGPLVGLLVGGAILAFTLFRGSPESEIGKKLIAGALFANIGWSIFNLLPIVPLDGGHIMAHGIAKLTKDRFPKAPHYVSIAVAVAVGAYAVYIQWLWVGMLAALYAFQNFRALQATGEATRSAEDESPRFDELAAGFKAIEAGNGYEAIRIAETLLMQSRLPEIRLGALRLLAYGRLLEGQWLQFMQLLENAPQEIGPQELERFEEAAREMEHPEEAERIRTIRESLGVAQSPFRA